MTLTGALADDELAAIYSGAHALVFPSDDEGFGLPPVEALACGTPVVACDVPALREVLGGRAVLRPVDDVEGLIAAAEAAERPAPSPPPWTWEDAAAATWEVYAARRRGLAASSGTARMRAGFVMLSSDEAPLLEHSLAAALADGFDEALVIDNASTDATAEVARRHGVERLELGRRLPYTEAMNAGLRRVSADAVALLQADTFVTPGYRVACLAALRDPSVGSVAPKLLRTRGPRREDRLPMIDAAAMSIDRRRKNSLVGHGSPAASYGVAADVFGADGAAAMYRRETLEDCAVGRRGVRREHARLGVRRRPRLAHAAARMDGALRAGGGRPPHPHLQPDDPCPYERAGPPHPVSEPLPDDRQERPAG